MPCLFFITRHTGSSFRLSCNLCYEICYMCEKWVLNVPGNYDTFTGRIKVFRRQPPPERIGRCCIREEFDAQRIKKLMYTYKSFLSCKTVCVLREFCYAVLFYMYIFYYSQFSGTNGFCFNVLRSKINTGIACLFHNKYNFYGFFYSVFPLFQKGLQQKRTVLPQPKTPHL